MNEKKSQCIDELIDRNPIIHDFKRKAKKLQQQLIKTYAENKVIPLRQCQDLVVQQHGYKHWHEFHSNIKKIYTDKLEDENLNRYIQYVLENKKDNYINLGYNPQLGMNALVSQDRLTKNVYITGEKKDKLELHLLKQLMETNQNIVYMDGSDNSEHIKKIKSYATSAGKEIRTLFFMTNFSKFEETNWYFPSNLPFSSGQLTDMLYSMLDNFDTESKAWKGRAISLMSTVIMVLVYMRDQNQIILNFEVIKTYIQYDNIVNLFNRRHEVNFPTYIIRILKNYLNSLPGYVENQIKQNNSVLEHHCFVQMQFQRPLDLLINVLKPLTRSCQDLQEASNRFNELFSSDNKNIFIVSLPSYKKMGYGELTTLSKFMLTILKYQTAKGYINQNKYENIKTLFINNCHLPVGFDSVTTQSTSFKTSVFFSYDKEILSDTEKNVDLDCHIKIQMESENKYKLLVNNNIEDLTI